MGTRGFVGFISNGELKGSYNHYDSYLTGVGKELQREVREHAWLFLKDRDDLRRLVNSTIYVNAMEKPDVEMRKKLTVAGMKPQNVSGGADWYAWLRNNQGSWVKPAKLGYATDERDFLKDSLFCEWGYVLDLNNWTVTILEGFNKDEAKQHPICKTEPSDSGYCGCAQVWHGSIEAFMELDLEKLEEELSED